MVDKATEQINDGSPQVTHKPQNSFDEASTVERNNQLLNNSAITPDLTKNCLNERNGKTALATEDPLQAAHDASPLANIQTTSNMIGSFASQQPRGDKLSAELQQRDLNVVK